MAAKSDIITVEILGTQLQLRGGDDPERVRQACRYVGESIDKITEQAPTMSSIKVALYAAIDMADDLLAHTKEMKTTIEDASGKAIKILEKTGEIDA